MDKFAYYNAPNEQKNEFLFQNVQHVWVPDLNSGSYPNGQVLFDLSSLSNRGKFLSSAESHIIVPLVVMTIFAGSTANAVENAFITSLKSGYYQLINSMSAEITNAQVVSLTNFSNLDINYKVLTTSSVEDERNFIPSINFHKDTAKSINCKAATDAAAVGEYNIVIKQSLFTFSTGWRA